MEEKIVVFALEPWMRLLLDLELNVAWHYARHLVTFTAEVDLVPTLDSLVYVHMKHLPLDDRLLAAAALATIFLPNDLAFSLAIWADCLEALNHWAHLTHHGLHTSTVAASTCLDCAFLTSTAIAGRANDGLL